MGYLYKKTHPRLLFSCEDIEKIKLKIISNKKYKNEVDEVLKEASELLNQAFYPEEYADSVYSQHGKYGDPANQVGRMGLYLGFAYQITGEPKYAEKLKEALLYYINYKKWTGSECLDRDPPWTSELNTARFLFGYSIGYDCIHDYLSENERNMIAQGAKRLGIDPLLNDWYLPERRIHSLDSMGHNWWAVCIAEAALGLLSFIDEIEGANILADKILNDFGEWFAYKGGVLQNKCPNFDKKGACYEGAGYANYGISEFLYFALSHMNMYGYKEIAYKSELEKISNYLIHSTYPTSKEKTPNILINFGDCYIYGNYCEAARLLLACGIDNPSLRWYLERQEPKYNIIDLIYEDRIRNGCKLPPYNLGTSVIYNDIGLVIIRNSWEVDSTLLAVKCGYTWNHAHADAGSFVLFHRGRPIIIDSGNCSYAREEYKSYYCQSVAHNVVLFNENGQNKDDIYYGVKHEGKVYNLIDSKRVKYVFADATGPMSRYLFRNFRHFIWLNNVILIYDDIKSYEEGIFNWLLHYEGNAKVKGKEIEIENNDSKLRIKSLFPKEIIINEKIGLKDHAPDTKINYLSFNTKTKSHEVKYLTTLILEEEKISEISAFEGKDFLAVCIDDGRQIIDVYFNLRADGRRMHQNSNLVINGYETDAYILALIKDKNDKDNEITDCFIVYGSYLRKEDKIIFDNLSKKFVELEFTK